VSPKDGWFPRLKDGLHDEDENPKDQECFQRDKKRPRKAGKLGSQSRHRPSRPFLQSRHAKESREIEVVIDNIRSRGDGTARIGLPCSCARSRIGERAKVRDLSVGEEFATRERST